MVTFEVEVSLKKGVVDPEGANVKKTLELLGFEGIEDVRFSRCYVISLSTDDREEGRRMVEEMCNRLLSNPVINTYAIRERD